MGACSFCGSRRDFFPSSCKRDEGRGAAETNSVRLRKLPELKSLESWDTTELSASTLAPFFLFPRHLVVAVPMLLFYIDAEHVGLEGMCPPHELGCQCRTK